MAPTHEAAIDRLGDQRVVVDRRDVVADRPDQRRVGAGGKQHTAGVDHAAVGDHRHRARQPTDRCVLVDPHARADRGCAQTVGKLAGMDEGRPRERGVEDVRTPQPATRFQRVLVHVLGALDVAALEERPRQP